MPSEFVRRPRYIKLFSRPYACGLEAALDLLDGKWKPLILRALFKGPARYSDLRRTSATRWGKKNIDKIAEIKSRNKPGEAGGRSPPTGPLGVLHPPFLSAG
jgi:hypothetical protein